MLLQQDLTVSITLDYLKSLPTYQKHYDANNVGGDCVFNIPKPIFNGIMHLLGVDLRHGYEVIRGYVRTQSNRRAKKSSIIVCKLRERIPSYLENMYYHSNYILKPKKMRNEVKVTNIGANNIDSDLSLEDLETSQHKDQSKERYIDIELEDDLEMLDSYEMMIKPEVSINTLRVRGDKFE